MNIDAAAREFLAQKRIAVAGVSARRDTPANLIFKTLRSRGITVVPISSSTKEYEGVACYGDVAALPEPPDGLIIVTNPATALELVRQCVGSGVSRVWMHSMFGTRPRFLKKAAERITSVSEEAVRLCRDNGITVIPGSCPMQFVGDPGHRCMHGILRVIGALEVPPETYGSSPRSGA